MGAGLRFVLVPGALASLGAGLGAARGPGFQQPGGRGWLSALRGLLCAQLVHGENHCASCAPISDRRHLPLGGVAKVGPVANQLPCGALRWASSAFSLKSGVFCILRCNEMLYGGNQLGKMRFVSVVMVVMDVVLVIVLVAVVVVVVLVVVAVVVVGDCWISLLFVVCSSFFCCGCCSVLAACSSILVWPLVAVCSSWVLSKARFPGFPGFPDVSRVFRSFSTCGLGSLQVTSLPGGAGAGTGPGSGLRRGVGGLGQRARRLRGGRPRQARRGLPLNGGLFFVFLCFGGFSK